MSKQLTFEEFEKRYKEKEYIGSGGFAKVYKVFDHEKNHYVALKISDVRPEWTKFTLKNEVELVNNLPYHRNIARYDACYRFNRGFMGEMDFAVLKFYEYGNLEQFLTREKITLEDKRIIIKGILNGISFLHENNIIHRDLKSQNILMHREDGVWTPKICDFGLSRRVLNDVTITNSSIGISYAYAAPEQIQNKKIYKNADLWSVGIIIYRIIANELPFTGASKSQNKDEKNAQSQLELSRKIVALELPAKLDTLPEPYQSIIKKCLVIKPADRFRNATDIIKVLDNPITITAKQKSVNKTNKEVKTKPKVTINKPKVKKETTPKTTEKVVPTKNIKIKKKTGYLKYGILLGTVLVALAAIFFFVMNKEVTSTTKAASVPSSTYPKALLELDQKNTAYRTNSRKLLEIEKEIKIVTSAVENVGNYRPHFILAKNEMYRTDYNAANMALYKAANVALKNQEASEMLLDLKNDTLNVFETLKSAGIWDELILILQEKKPFPEKDTDSSSKTKKKKKKTSQSKSPTKREPVLLKDK